MNSDSHVTAPIAAPNTISLGCQQRQRERHRQRRRRRQRRLQRQRRQRRQRRQ